jgi:hypothetical protein
MSGFIPPKLPVKVGSAQVNGTMQQSRPMNSRPFETRRSALGPRG